MRKAGIGEAQSSGAATLEFQIEGEIKGAMLHGKRSMKFADDGRLRAWGLGGRAIEPAIVPQLTIPRAQTIREERRVP
jgi:hypothetical protein